MGVHKIKKGLNLPISGAPEQKIHPARVVSRVGLLSADYIDVKPRFLVEAGEPVKRGTPLFEDKRNPGVIYTAPGAGTVAAINRGERRALLSIVIDLSEAERNNPEADEVYHPFESFHGKDPAALSRDEIKALLLESGLWTCIRQRPFSRVASPDKEPTSLFLTFTDTQPLAADVATVIAGQEADLQAGMTALSKLTSGTTYLCKTPTLKVAPPANTKIQVEEFAGVHPAGNVGTHIHLLDPVGPGRTAWHVGYQDVIAVGHLFRTGRLPVDRVISLAGPGASQPRLLRTRIGAGTEQLLQDELKEGEQRVVSGSVLSGRQIAGEVLGYLGRFHNQISVLKEGREREFFGWMGPGVKKFSVTRAFLSTLIPDQKFDFTTTTNGSPRAMVPIGVYERVVPLDILPTFLLRSMIVHDIEQAERLGILELDEEDLSLCTFVCPSKYNYGAILRHNLNIIEREG
jgi:Na+-transporting NADH:ubiquinone oxidoreductase subunit A